MEQQQSQGFSAICSFDCTYFHEPVTANEALAIQESAGTKWHIPTEDDLGLILGSHPAYLPGKTIWITDDPKRTEAKSAPVAIFDPVLRRKQYSTAGTKHRLLLVSILPTKLLVCGVNPELKRNLEHLSTLVS